MLLSSMPWLLKTTGSKSGRRKLEDIPVMTDQVTCGIDITRFGGANPYLGHESIILEVPSLAEVV